MPPCKEPTSEEVKETVASDGGTFTQACSSRWEGRSQGRKRTVPDQDHHQHAAPRPLLIEGDTSKGFGLGGSMAQWFKEPHRGPDTDSGNEPIAPEKQYHQTGSSHFPASEAGLLPPRPDCKGNISELPNSCCHRWQQGPAEQWWNTLP